MITTEVKKVKTKRLEMAYRQMGTPGKPKLLLVHGNMSSSVFYVPLMERLREEFDMIAVDLRLFGDTEIAPVDATRGLRDFSDDVDAFVCAIGWESFSMLGWSMGGGVTMQYAIDHGDRLESIMLQNPISPYGLGGCFGPDGQMTDPPGLGGGAGACNKQMLQAIADKGENGGREFLGGVYDRLYVEPTFHTDPEDRELYIDSMLTSKLGDDKFPGNYTVTDLWPGFIAGDKGNYNAMSSKYLNLSALADAEHKAPILWIRGAADVLVTDTSTSDVGYLGKIGRIPGWPGEEVFPPQPMVLQTRTLFEKYRENGGYYRETVIPGGHGCMIDHPDEFVKAIEDFIPMIEVRQ